MIDRPKYVQRLERAIHRAPITALLGPRQCGKTTLAKLISGKHESVYFDLESPTDIARLANPALTLESMEGLIIIDEIQRQPELFPLLRVLADEPSQRRRFLILGSASPTVIRNTSETLAGRIEFVDLRGFDITEVGVQNLDRLWIRGGFPLSYTANTADDSSVWLENFTRTFLERDIPMMGFNLSPITLRRFWSMLAHYHIQVFNSSELARSLGVSDKTIKNYLDILEGTYMVRQLAPWHENLKKRQVKSPKVYLQDSGILHSLLSIPNKHALLGHPKLGSSWEGFVLEQIIGGMSTRDCYFWATHSGAELDLMVIHNGRRIGFELKWNDAPKLTRSMRIAVADLNLQELYIVYPGSESYPLARNIKVITIKQLNTIIP